MSGSRAIAAAKINLALLVGPRREDGLHEVATVLQRVDVCDRLELGPADELEVVGFEEDAIVSDALARLAAEAGREVMAVPGSPLDPRAQGCNGLIRDGATLVQNAADVIEAVRPTLGQVASPGAPFDHAPEPLDAEPDLRDWLESLLGPSPVTVDELVRQSGASAGAVQLVLLELDLEDRCAPMPLAA